MMGSGGVRLKWFVRGCIFSFMAAVVVPAHGGILFPSAAGHPDARSASAVTAQPGRAPNKWSGKYQVTTSGGTHFADLEYAVFSAAKFSALFPGVDTPNGGVAAGEMVYAFQWFDNGAISAGITQTRAGLADLGPPPSGWGDGDNDDELVGPGDAWYVPGTGKVPSNSSSPANAVQVFSGSVAWNFGTVTANRLRNEWSAILFYTSPYGPRWDNAATTSGGGIGLSAPIPGPEVGIAIPEPATAFLALLGAVLAMAARRRVSP